MYGAPPGRGGPVLQGIPSLKVEPANLRRTQSAVELRTLSSGMGSRRSSTTDLNHVRMLPQLPCLHMLRCLCCSRSPS